MQYDEIIKNNLIQIFDDYYKKYHKALDVYSSEVKELDTFDIVKLIKILNSDIRFFNIDNITFGLLQWLLNDIKTYLSLNEKIDFDTVYEIAKNTFGCGDFSEYFLRQLFDNGYLYVSQNQEQAFLVWLKEKRGFSENNAKNYVAAIDSIMDYDKVSRIAKMHFFFIKSPTEIKRIINLLLSSNYFLIINREKNYLYSTALNKYLEFLTDL